MIQWDVSPDIFTLGPITIRWYGLLFALTFIIGYQIMYWIFKREGKDENDVNDLVWFMVLGTVIGARLGHCLFYNPSYYLSNPLEILQVWKGGLASHGAGIGLFTAVYIYSKKKEDQSYLWVADRLTLPVALSGLLVRTGNLFNSEIVGKPTDGSWGFVFTSVDDIPRHPTQIYEAASYLIVFWILFFIYKSKGKELKDGFLLGLFLAIFFSIRFYVEFFKENQTYFEQGMPLNMGQILSIPLLILGIFLMIRSKRNTETAEK
ncbi:prolipoprotein diacylglyceryl transferase [Bacteroidota bacterium]